MSKAGKHTHGQLAVATVIPSAGLQPFGSITLPAGGPWVIHHVYGQCVNNTVADTTDFGQRFSFIPATGDLAPTSIPSDFPFPPFTRIWGTPNSRIISHLTLQPVFWTAPGKAILTINTNSDSGFRNNERAIIGILYSPTIPQPAHSPFSAFVSGATAGAAETSLGTITLSEGARKITSITALLEQGGGATPTTQAVAFIRLDSADFAITPAQFPVNAIFGFPRTANQPSMTQHPLVSIPLDIPVPKGARIDCFVTLHEATASSEVISLYLQYE